MSTRNEFWFRLSFWAGCLAALSVGAGCWFGWRDDIYAVLLIVVGAAIALLVHTVEFVPARRAQVEGSPPSEQDVRPS